MRFAPAALSIAKRVVPKLARGVVRLGRQLVNSPAGKQAVRTLPTIARRTAADVLRTHARGRPVTGRTVTRALARHSARVLRNPQRRRRAAVRSRRVAKRAKKGINLRMSRRCRCV